MAMPRNTDRPMYFDSVAYIVDLRKAVRKATLKARDIVYEEALKRASNLPFKDDNKVRISVAGREKMVTDAERAGALLRSIKKNFDYIEQETMSESMSWFYTAYVPQRSKIRGIVTAMDDNNYKDSHIGIYYEYGTGTKQIVPYAGLGEANPYRSTYNAPLVTRPRGTWIDDGGNVRISKSANPGTTSTYFMRHIQGEVQAHEWFRKSLDDNRGRILKIYKEAIKSVNPFDRKYFHLKRKIELRGK